MVLSIVLVALGLGSGWAVYGRKPRVSETSADPLATVSPGLIAFLAAKLKFDELYAATFGRLNNFSAAFANFLEVWLWGGIVTLLARLGEFTGLVNRETDERTLNGGFDNVSEKVRGTGLVYSRAQTGDAHGYVRFIALGFVLIVLIVVMGGAK
jgi:NADH-quinone oxidoreductase subunit L